MVTKFKESLMRLTGIEDLHPAAPENPSILLAVSGGIDSMCMAHLFSRLFYSNFAIATVNFSLRGEESDGDEELVRDWAKERGIRYFSNTFDTKAYAKSAGISTQMAARDLRYTWFETLIQEHKFDYLAVAHNLNDSVETFFINVLRGTGIQGMTGIPKKNGNIIRPLICFTRREIAEYTKSENIPFRVDSSNYESHYSRNRLRNMVFPEFEIINQSFLKTVERDMENVEAASDIITHLFEQKRDLLLDRKTMRISIPALLQERRPDYWLYMLLDEFGFNPMQTEQVYNALKGQPGKEFHSDSFLILKDRDYLLIYPKGTPTEAQVVLPEISVFEKPSETQYADEDFFELLEDEKEGLNADQALQPGEQSGQHTDQAVQPAEQLNQRSNLPIQDPDRSKVEQYIPTPETEQSSKQESDKLESEKIFARVEVKNPGDYKELTIGGIKMRLSVYPKPAGFKFKKERVKTEFTGDLFVTASSVSVFESTLLLDADLLHFPLYVRRWMDGDKFIPLGMNGYKKVSDYLIDIKMDKKSKESLHVLLSDDKIAALPGFRVDERFKITNNTKNILEISLL